MQIAICQFMEPEPWCNVLSGIALLTWTDIRASELAFDQQNWLCVTATELAIEQTREMQSFFPDRFSEVMLQK